ncbi:hypothetical protein CALVIDRAFT_324631 [Calocera viscosa TUFC12733]|uniref:Uncharacterized protein n=1 Tax=Calocera viscosa (strain TUFC12733) TaxID=1330018 RepID=A0A167QSY4_CALVF|nr:hypothetical protein CALVIDRAFT_324631 [Calocera viscosa TUFC12733]
MTEAARGRRRPAAARPARRSSIPTAHHQREAKSVPCYTGSHHCAGRARARRHPRLHPQPHPLPPSPHPPPLLSSLQHHQSPPLLACPYHTPRPHIPLPPCRRLLHPPGWERMYCPLRPHCHPSQCPLSLPAPSKIHHPKPFRPSAQPSQNAPHQMATSIRRRRYALRSEHRRCPSCRGRTQSGFTASWRLSRRRGIMCGTWRSSLTSTSLPSTRSIPSCTRSSRATCLRCARPTSVSCRSWRTPCLSLGCLPAPTRRI